MILQTNVHQSKNRDKEIAPEEPPASMKHCEWHKR